ncbi:putative membrane protein YdjX (TVP38/TMEM64 family) [Halomonas fontilapidosi]|uniref:TVP38/TMEM64 family membrane protein n=1 Tax=Halomonas fontilapidosi TaxID=616675 RepID=A0A7W5H0H5_9GAMM|nr:putative membrane protein YdjX (TVP38/TMEM64 family) [Halomonas fontilapidosi]
MTTPAVWAFRAGLLATVTAIMAGIWWLLQGLGLPMSFSPSGIAVWFNSQGNLGPLLLLLLMMLAVVVGPIPTLPVTAAAGLAFGLVPGVLLSIIGAMTGAMIAFTLARLLGRDALRARLPSNPLFGIQGSQRLLFLTVLVTRLVPIFSFALVSYAAGVTAITAGRFALGTVVGMLPMTLVFVSLGRAFELHPLLSITAAVAILTAMTLLPWYLSRRRHSRLARWLHLDDEPPGK